MPWYFNGLIDGMRCGILAVDREGALLMINSVGLQILEQCEAPTPGMQVSQAFTDHPQIARVFQDCFSMTSLPNRAELDLTMPGGERKTIGFTVSMIAEESDGGARGAAIFFKDLTQIEQKEEQERLKDRLAALGQMAASLAHEIRNPLASIEVTCSLLRRRLSDTGPERELLGKITGEVRRLNRTITSSLEFVRPVALHLRIAELTPLLESAISVATQRCSDVSVEVVRRYSGKLAPCLMDAGQIRQVFENLLLNAIEAVGDGGTVRVQTEVVPAPHIMSVPYQPEESGQPRDPWQSYDSFVQVQIADDGPGLSAEARDKVFYPFFTTKAEGSGVGLPMAKKIVTSHRGLIDIGDAPEGGALFCVRIPMVTEMIESPGGLVNCSGG